MSQDRRPIKQAVATVDVGVARRIPYALCTDVGASPTTSLLCEMVQFLRVHAGRSTRATPSEALFATTLAPAQILGLADRLGSFDVGKDFSFIEVQTSATPTTFTSADDAILRGLLEVEPADLRRYEPGGELGTLVDRLIATGLPVGEELARLTTEISKTAARVDDKVVRTILAGREAWSRS